MSVSALIRALKQRHRSMPVLSGIFANFFNQGVTLLTQIASLPIFLHYWGSVKYGEWIIISTIPAYFAMSDIGIVSVATNKMGMCWARGQIAEANVTFQTALGGVSLISVVGAVLAALGCYAFGQHESGAATALLFLILTAFISMYSGLVDAAFRLVDRYAEGIYILSVARFGEWAAGAVAVVLGGDFVIVALAMFGARAVFQVGMAVYLARIIPELRWSFSGMSRREFRELIPMGAAFLGFPLGNALVIQGITLVVGHAFGAREVVVFNSYRTISRSVTQLITTVSRSVWPRFSHLYGKGDYDAAHQLRTKAEYGIFMLACACCVPLAAGGSWIIHVWSRGQLPYEPKVFLPLLLTTVVTSLYQVKLVALMSTNRHSKVSLQFCAISAATLALSWALSPMFGALVPVMALLAGEAATWFAVDHAFGQTRKMEIRHDPVSLG